MSFGLLTAVSVDDIPHILRTCAKHYRGTQTAKFKYAWEVAADEVERFADELTEKIIEAKKTERSKRVRIRL